ncbi:MAG: IS200/IS605 family transposase [Planctomycetota bacterium]|nr:IS200/IS605 family transposase [Planctomycetota bacterium]MDA1214398.1 IS200/IS605 family transposase [Planctomycetota bacterium]
MTQSFVCLHVHVVFSTKNRQPFITDDLAPRLYDYMGGVVSNRGGKLLTAGGVADHVHLLISLHKEMAMSEFVRIVKSNSSKWIHETFAELKSFAWQTGYGAFGVSFSDLARVKRYIANQQEHHRRQTFKEEFLELLRRHDMEFDERYLWD